MPDRAATSGQQSRPASEQSQPASQQSQLASRQSQPVVVGLGPVDPALVSGVLGGRCRFVATPGDAELAAAAGAIVRADARVDEALLRRAPALRVIARTGVGVDLVDVTAATARGIAVVITPGAGAAAVAEGAIGMALHLVKRFGPLTALVREGRWAQRTAISVGDLDGATLGVVGYGRIGQRTAELGAAFGMTVLAYDPVSEPPAGLRCRDLPELAARSDVISLHLPLTAQTRHLVDRAFLAQVRPGAVLINCSRGGLIDTDAVLAALTGGRLSGVGLDVFDPEPPGSHPLFGHPDVVLTPHLMGLSRRATAATFTAAAQGILDVLDGREPRAVANPGWRTGRPADSKEISV
jgi:D-3-phosphoglycerate dehydrogenase / 2-oxoglutarate reductase